MHISLFLVICSFWSVQVLPLQATEIMSRIYNGEVAQDGQFSYMVPLWRGYTFICSSQVITPTTILTAAHCIARGPNRTIVPAEELRIKYGSLDARKGKTIKIRKIIAFPRFGEKASLNDDIALLLTKNPLPPKVKQIAIPSKLTTFPIGTDVIQIGWGKTNRSGNSGKILRFAYSKIILQENCKLVKDSYASKTRICAAQLNRHGICPGDSGGPLIAKNVNGEPVTLGVASYLLKSCFINNPNAAAVYTSISFYSDWIKQNAEGKLKIIT